MKNYHKKRQYTNYVIQLDEKAWNESTKFRNMNKYKNIHHKDKYKSFLYVGTTGIDPDKRIKQHLNGYKNNQLVQRYGLAVITDLEERRPDYTTATKNEVTIARRLRRQGHAVYAR
jgi:hypothetical protein